MPFTAVHPEFGRLDATLPDLSRALAWTRIHRVRTRMPLHCPECGRGIHPKLSPRRIRYFAHDPGRPPDCESSNESFEHRVLKLELATAIRQANWYATLEVRAEDGTWRADVMAASPDGTRRVCLGGTDVPDHR